MSSARAVMADLGGMAVQTDPGDGAPATRAR